MDTGCPQDLISTNLAQARSDLYVTAKRMRFDTANGRAKSTSTALPLRIGAFNGTPANPYIMESCNMLVLSIGKRCSDISPNGISFFWINGHWPCALLSDWRTVVPLQVDDDVPYLTRDCSGLCDAYTIKRLTALDFTNEKDGRFCDAFPARAADHSSSRSSADPGTGKLDNDCDSVHVPTAASEDEEDSNNDDENVDAAVTDGEENVRRSLKDEAQSVRHKTTHKPALPEHCDACKIGKTRNARKYKGKICLRPTALR